MLKHYQYPLICITMIATSGLIAEGYQILAQQAGIIIDDSLEL